MRTFSLLAVSIGILLSSLSVKAQSAAYLILNQEYYTLGGQIEFAILSTPEALPNGSVVEAVINGPDGEIVWRGFSRCSQGGAILSRVELGFRNPAGVYTMRIFGLAADLPDPQVLAKAIFPVYDDLNSESWPSEAYELDYTNLADIKVSDLSFTAPNSVREAGVIEATTKATLTHVLDTELIPNRLPRVFKGEIAGTLDSMLWVNGKWSTVSGDPVATNLLGVLRTNETSFEFAKSNQEGEFLYRAAPFNEVQQLQFVEQLVKDRRVTRKDLTLAPTEYKLPWWEGLSSLLKASAQRKTVYAAYGKSDFRVEETIKSSPVFVRKGDVAISVDNYSAFPDFGTFAYEVFGTAARWRPTKKGHYIRVYDRRRKQYFKQEPLVLINGFVALDNNELSKLNPAGLDSVHIHGTPSTLRKSYPALGQNGVIRLQGKTGFDTSPYVDEKSVLAVMGISIVRNRVDEKVNWDSELPWLSPSVCFNLGVVDFVHTDDRSKFSVETYEVASDGSLVSKRSYYDIK